MIATVVYAIGIPLLFALDYDRRARTSKALWLPVVWVSLAASRMVSRWLDPGLAIETADQYAEGNPLDRDILTGLIVLGLLVLCSRRREVGKLLRANGPILLFLAYGGLSILW